MTSHQLNKGRSDPQRSGWYYLTDNDRSVKSFLLTLIITHFLTERYASMQTNDQKTGQGLAFWLDKERHTYNPQGWAKIFVTTK